MCLAVPGRIVRQYDTDDTAMAEVDFGGVLKEVCLQYLPDASIGDYVIVHVGFAIQRLDEESAIATLANFESLGILEQEFGNEFDRAAAAMTREAADAEATTSTADGAGR
jgi:hydrogenase expression/formation protein HypC